MIVRFMPRCAAFACSAALVLTLSMAGAATFDDEQPGRFAGDGIVIGYEYAVTDNPRLVKSMAEAFAELGLPGMKHYVEAVQWGNMQNGPDQPIDFTKMDLFVREYQRQGFTELTMSLKPHSRWASIDVRMFSSTNASPKPEYRDDFQAWVQACVERYDGDGMDDMPGLRWPVRHIEIGNEFSSYQPEPVEEYLVTLELAYDAAHRASEDVLIGHAAFLITPVNMDVDDASEYDERWENTRRVDMHHGLEDMRAVLDRPEIFDIINIHNLGDPYEIEHVLRWLDYETRQRGYSKDVMISDTLATSYIGWGSAVDTEGSKIGVVASPATEDDRERLAAFFTKLIEKDEEALAWTRGFVAADHVQRAVIAAEQDVRVINLAFTGDIWFMTTKFSKAGAGISAWGGAIRANNFTGRIHEKFPSYYAVKQLMSHLNGYTSIRRVAHQNDRARVYEIEGRNGRFWIAWRDPKAALLPEDGSPSMKVRLDVGVAEVEIESVITGMGEVEPERLRKHARNGRVAVTLTHTPKYILPIADE